MVELGDTVEDTITGFQGIAVARYSYIASPSNISIQPIVNLYGNLPDSEMFVESLLRVIKTKEKKVVIVKKMKGGD